MHDAMPRGRETKSGDVDHAAGMPRHIEEAVASLLADLEDIVRRHL